MLYIPGIASAEIRHGSAGVRVFFRQPNEQGHGAIAFSVVNVVLPAFTGDGILALRLPVE